MYHHHHHHHLYCTDLMSCSISGGSARLAMKTRPLLTASLLLCHHRQHQHRRHCHQYCHHHNRIHCSFKMFLSLRFSRCLTKIFQDSKIGTYNKMWRFMEQVSILSHHCLQKDQFNSNMINRNTVKE